MNPLLTNDKKKELADLLMEEVEDRAEQKDFFRNSVAMMMHARNEYKVDAEDAMDVVKIMKGRYADELLKMGYKMNGNLIIYKPKEDINPCRE